MLYLDRARRDEAAAARYAARADRFESAAIAALIFGLIFLVWLGVVLLTSNSWYLPAIGAFFFLVMVGPTATLIALYSDRRWRQAAFSARQNNQTAALMGERSWVGVPRY